MSSFLRNLKKRPERIREKQRLLSEYKKNKAEYLSMLESMKEQAQQVGFEPDVVFVPNGGDDSNTPLIPVGGENVPVEVGIQE